VRSARPSHCAVQTCGRASHAVEVDVTSEPVDTTWWGRLHSAPPHAYFFISALFHYLGPAFAVLLFARVDVLGVAWLRIASAALVFSLWRRPWRSWRRQTSMVRRTIVWWGVVLAAMNSSFYISIDRLPLATVAAIEFLGPIVLAALGIRSRRNAVALVVAGAGVYVLTGIRLEGEPLGFVFAFVNSALFATYVVLGHRVAQTGPSLALDSLGMAMLVAAAVAAPVGIWDAGVALLDPVALLAGAGVGISSSLIPYVFDQLALGRLPRATYALFVSLLPATAVIIGVVVLRQIPSPADMAGVAMVIAGVVVHEQPKQDTAALAVRVGPE
jgi:inner membrane transporter RhtA